MKLDERGKIQQVGFKMQNYNNCIWMRIIESVGGDTVGAILKNCAFLKSRLECEHIQVDPTTNKMSVSSGANMDIIEAIVSNMKLSSR